MNAKLSSDSLAIFGGVPAFANKLHVGRPNVGDRARLLERINDIFDTRWLTNDGPYSLELERRIADYVGVKHCIAMCNATVALEIAIRALGMRGEVIIPSFTFVATAHALQWQEITPVFCDIDPETYNLDPRRVEQLVTPQTTGIIGVHVFGRPCDTEALSEIAKRRNLALLFDAAHAFGCSYGGRLIGSFGDAEVFSFHATKFLNTLEGGAVVTNDDALATRIRLMKNFGFTYYDRTDYIGINGKMNEVSAATGLTNLESIDEFISINQRNYQLYREELAGVRGIDLIVYDDAEKSNYQYVVLEINEREVGLTRDQLVEVLQAENILARRYFYPGCHSLEPYKSLFPDAGVLLPETERLTRRVLCLPTGTAIGVDEVKGISRILKFAIENSEVVGTRLAQPNATRAATGVSLDSN